MSVQGCVCGEWRTSNERLALCPCGEKLPRHPQPLPPPPYDAINPTHYRAANGIESIDVIEAFFMDKPHRWPALKYLFRAGRKPGQDEVQDLRKAIWWIEREIALFEKLKLKEVVERYTFEPFVEKEAPKLDGRN